MEEKEIAMQNDEVEELEDMFFKPTVDVFKVPDWKRDFWALKKHYVEDIQDVHSDMRKNNELVDSKLENCQAQINQLCEQDDEQMYEIEQLQLRVKQLEDIIFDLTGRLNDVEMDKKGYHFC